MKAAGGRQGTRDANNQVDGGLWSRVDFRLALAALAAPLVAMLAIYPASLFGMPSFDGHMAGIEYVAVALVAGPIMAAVVLAALVAAAAPASWHPSAARVAFWVSITAAAGWAALVLGAMFVDWVEDGSLGWYGMFIAFNLFVAASFALPAWPAARLRREAASQAT